jgi:4-amino-4-deoxy-L-arabinose transferase-like glycosyltransferase
LICRLPPLRAALYLILAVFTVLALLYSAIVPIFEAPDETAHVSFVRFLRANKRLPQQGQSGEAHQPPLYYILAALISLPAGVDDLAELERLNPNWAWAGVGQDINAIYHTAAELFPWRGATLAIHLMRILSVLLGVSTVLVVYLMGLELFPSAPLIPLAAATIAAFNPQFVFISSVVNNDSLANLCAAVALWMMVRLLLGRTNRWTLLGLGLALGLGLMAKQSLLVLIPLAALVLAYASFRQRSLRMLLEAGLIVGGVVLFIAGWWYLRNLALYGDAFGINAFVEYRPGERIATVANMGELRVFLRKMHRSFWGEFGWANLPMPAWFYSALVGLYVLAAIGGGLAWIRKRQAHASPWSVWALLLVLPVLFLLWVVTYGYRFGGSGWQGRYLLPALPAIALLLAAGLAHLFDGRRQAIPLVLIGLALLVLSVFALLHVIQPAYATVTRPVSDLEKAQHPMDVNFGELIRLEGYDLSITSEAGEPGVWITLYWRAIDQPPADFKVFVHLVDLDWELYGQGDGYPLQGRFPTSAWRTGDLIVDPHFVQFQQPITAGEYRIAIGWYLESTGERLSTVHEGQETGTVAETSPFDLQP